MNKFWLQNYPAGVPADVNVDEYRSVTALLEASYEKFKNDNAYVCMGRFLTYGQVDELSSSLAAWLQSQGLKKGDRVAIMLPNLLQFPIAAAAILRAGLIIVNVNPMYTPRELEHQLKDSGAETIFILDSFAPTLVEVIQRTPIKSVILSGAGDMLGAPDGTNDFGLPNATRFNLALAAGRELELQKPDIGPDDIAVLQYTGGTTGVSKGAVLLHKTLVANLLSSEAWTQPGLKRKTLTGQFNMVTAIPLYHVFAFIVCNLLSNRLGALSILIPNPRDLPGMIKTLQGFKINSFPAVNTLFNSLAHDPEFAKLDFSELAVSTGGGMAVQEAVAKKWLEVTGCPISEGYGLTETSAGIASNPTDTDAYTGTIGLPMPGVEIRIIDDNGNDVPAGERGEIAIRGPQVMAGYWQRPDETANVMTPDGFFKSGDIGIMDERGYTRIVDRKKDMILVSGFNVYPNEIEGVVVSHPGVLECAAIGVPDKNTGEAVKVFVVKHDPSLTEADLIEFCKEQLTGYKRPRTIEFRDDLPKSNVGKILRRELRDEVLKTAAQAAE
ncbi:long-chain-fatty-acid--CoA ligase [Variibacter gotjawalensis]|uniref:Long-chain-fatty-acid--CoA ligase n=1 Tax=Variibacter gotjawalensis TaxID=1333996 RepID=A0A0S3PZM4_9BRAD|nr:AMP-binding protein [Variibacter gotjawalensis]NIK47209.1 long-chain acyl-CoA synthetase [Variibacter gotjawalensis]RZS49109.1 long-chain acyl-CoA synthetase [Variibacter gotjawalensis]BAT61371.1 long-chain-fatty-acid--CoA ligase [Variibacter gotjawalensis]